MAKILFRLDDRLIHGQVVVGWKDIVNPEMIILISDEIAADAFEADLYKSVVPEGTEAKVIYVSETKEFLDNIISSGKNAIFLFENTDTLNNILDLKISLDTVNIGGLHYRDNTKEILPYVYVSDRDIGIFEKSLSNGVRLYCQDLPVSKKLFIDNKLLSNLH